MRRMPLMYTSLSMQRNRRVGTTVWRLNKSLLSTSTWMEQESAHAQGNLSRPKHLEGQWAVGAHGVSAVRRSYVGDAASGRNVSAEVLVRLHDRHADVGVRHQDGRWGIGRGAATL